MNDSFIYLDNNSTTRMDERVLTAMLPYLRENYGNAASSHNFGLNINKAVKDSRYKVASIINAKEDEVIFTSGATEGINLALKGLAFSSDARRHIITVVTEHKAVLDTCKFLESIGFEITYLPVNNYGEIDIDLLQNEIRNDTLALCIMWVNNETGIISQVETIGKIAREKGIMFISDATQAVGKLPIDVQKNNVDILIFSAHKFYGPKGIGAVYINSRTVAKNAINPIQHGGGHENGFRSGTLNVPAIIGMGEACSIADSEIKINEERIGRLRDYLELELQKITGVQINGNKGQRVFNTSNFQFLNFDANLFIAMHKNIAVSNGSACTSAIVEPSHVLTAMGLSEDQAFGSIRVSFSKWNTIQQVDEFIHSLKTFLTR